jgi:small subunit ribosomal protein S16
MFRIVVQDSRKSPTSGKLIAQLGHYDPHTKDIKLDKEKAETFIKNGAQPSKRVASLLKAQGVKLPKWVVFSPNVKKAVKNPEKRRSTATKKPAEPTAEVPKEEVASEESVPEVSEEENVQTEATEPTEKPEEAAAETNEKTEDK